MRNKVVIKERDEWSAFAEFIGNMVAKLQNLYSDF